MKKRWRLKVVLFIVLTSIGCINNSHPADESLLYNFHENEQRFELLLKMAKEDSHMIRVARSFTWTKKNASFPRPKSEIGISDERWSQYKNLFDELDLDAGILNYQPERTEFISSTKGLMTGGSSKGYVYLLNKPNKLEKSLDNFDESGFNKDINYAYKKIKGNWYLYYEVSG